MYTKPNIGVFINYFSILNQNIVDEWKKDNNDKISHISQIYIFIVNTLKLKINISTVKRYNGMRKKGSIQGFDTYIRRRYVPQNMKHICIVDIFKLLINDAFDQIPSDRISFI